MNCKDCGKPSQKERCYDCYKIFVNKNEAPAYTTADKYEPSLSSNIVLEKSKIMEHCKREVERITNKPIDESTSPWVSCLFIETCKTLRGG